MRQAASGQQFSHGLSASGFCDDAARDWVKVRRKEGRGSWCGLHIQYSISDLGARQRHGFHFGRRGRREEGGWIEFSYLHTRARWLREILDLVSDKAIDFGRVLQMSMLEFVGCAPSAAYIEIEGVW